MHLKFLFRYTFLSIFEKRLCNSFILNINSFQIRKLHSTQYLCKKRQEKKTQEDVKNSMSWEEIKKSKAPSLIPIWKNITIRELAENLNKPIDHVFEVMIYIPNADQYEQPNSPIDNLDIVKEIVKKSGFRFTISAPPTKINLEKIIMNEKDIDLTSLPVREKELAPRSPVITIMGHVDHGKTTLLDTLRNTNVVDGEAGGITQTIGAFKVSLGEKSVTFIDTPGHAAFTSMRNRGANATDIIVLVVAADDGVMEQTRESIRMAKEAQVPIIVAINKIDKGNANIEKSKHMLLQEGIQLEDFNGDVQSVAISALKGTNIDSLIECLLLQAEMMNLKSENRGMVEGVVLESRLDQGRGKVSTALVQRGMLRKSAFLVAGTAYVKVRGMFDHNGDVLNSAGPSTPVEIIGWKNLPSAGDTIFEVESEKRAKEVIEYRQSLLTSKKQEEDLVHIEQKRQEHEQIYKPALVERRRLKRFKRRREGPREKEYVKDENAPPKLLIVVKGDLDGSVESFLDVLESYDCYDQCQLDIVHYGVGNITQNDVHLAETFGAHIYAYDVQIPKDLELECHKKGIKVRLSKIIYRLIESIKKDIEEILPPVDKDEVIGEGEIIQIFKVTEEKKKIFVAGSRCVSGVLKKNLLYKVLRDNEEVVWQGKIGSMKYLKDDVEQVKNGSECGLQFDDKNFEPKQKDKIICYEILKLSQKCEWNPGF